MKIQGPGLRKAVRIIRKCRVQVRGKLRQLSENKKPRLWKITRAIDKSKAQAYGKSREPSGEFPCGPDGAIARRHSCEWHCVLLASCRSGSVKPIGHWVVMGARGECHLASFLFLMGIYEVSNGVMLGFAYEFCLSSFGFQMEGLWGVLMGFSSVLHECRASILLCDS